MSFSSPDMQFWMVLRDIVASALVPVALIVGIIVLIVIVTSIHTARAGQPVRRWPVVVAGVALVVLIALALASVALALTLPSTDFAIID